VLRGDSSENLKLASVSSFVDWCTDFGPTFATIGLPVIINRPGEQEILSRPVQQSQLGGGNDYTNLI
jgi:hypothetical protein